MENVILNGEQLHKKLQNLQEVRVDKENWLIYYIGKNSDEKWVKEYPHSEMHAGGPPQLRQINSFPWER